MDMQWQPKNLDEFYVSVHELFDYIIQNYSKKDSAAVVCLSGNLGTGKTTTTQEIAKILGISETLQSPTFVIRKSYVTSHPVFKKLIHIDAYRLTEQDNLALFHFEDDFNSPETLVIIEWPEMIQQIIPDYAISVFLEYAGEGRTITIK